MKVQRTYHSTPEQLAAAGTFLPTPDVVWDGDDVDYEISKADWERMDAAASGRRGGGRV